MTVGESGRCPFTKQTDRKLVGNIAKLSATADAFSKLDLLREPLSAAAHSAGERVRELESSGSFSCLKTKPVNMENEIS